MHDIDFLPAHYRQQSLRRQSQPWRIAVVLALLGLLAGAEYTQRCRRARVEADLKAIEPQYQQTLKSQKLLTETQARLTPVRASAELVTFLRHPWPRTQLVAAIVEPLPEDITLREVNLHQLRNTKQTEELRLRDDTEKESSLPPAARDLELLRDECNHAKTVIVLQGRAGVSAAVHRYLGCLAQHPLFAKVKLESMENVEDGQGEALAFHATLLIRPGYGQPGGPTAPPESMDVAGAGRGSPKQPLAALATEDAS